MMKSALKLAAAITIFAVASVAFCRCDFLRPLAGVSSENRYERAVQQTVLIVTPSGSQGSGVVIKRSSPDGERLFVWTAAHVTCNADTFDVIKSFPSGTATFKAHLIASDTKFDVALLQLDAPTILFQYAEFAPENYTGRIGDWIYHCGNVLGQNYVNLVSRGIISHEGNILWALVDVSTLQAEHGCSGGPVYAESNQQVIGILIAGIARGQYVGYVPVREIWKFAKSEGVRWAVYGNYCPSDATLKILIDDHRVAPNQSDIQE